MTTTSIQFGSSKKPFRGHVPYGHLVRQSVSTSKTGKQISKDNKFVPMKINQLKK